MAQLLNAATASSSLFKKLTDSASSVEKLSIATAKSAHELNERVEAWAARSSAIMEILKHERRANNLDKEFLDIAKREYTLQSELEADPQLAKLYYELKNEFNNELDKHSGS